jgi:hypothetical protein
MGRERDQTGGGQHAHLSHAAAQHLPHPPRPGDEVPRAQTREPTGAPSPFERQTSRNPPGARNRWRAVQARPRH